MATTSSNNWVDREKAVEGQKCKGEEPEHCGPNFRPHSPGGHRDDVHNAVTVP